MMRLILALSALSIIYIDPSEPDRYVALTYGALLFYSAYSAVLYYLSVKQRPLPTGITSWIDVGCYLLLVALSSGTSSIFFYFFFFAILVSSFHKGFETGVRVTLVSAILFTIIGFVTAPAGGRFELNRFLLRPIYLLVLGYMMAYWGGYEIMLKRRLTLLKEVAHMSNPRFGVSHTIGTVMKKLRALYDADACLLILPDSGATEPRLYRVERDQPGMPVRAERIPVELAQSLLAIHENVAVVYNGRARRWPWQTFSYYAYDVMTKERTGAGKGTSRALAATFEAESFASVPLRNRGHTLGRLYITARQGVFDNSDVEFVMQIVEQVIPVIENIRLLDQLASNAAEQERQRLARDIHDSVIQPYVGLQYRLAAIRNKLATGGGDDVANDIERLFQITVDEISGLRGFVRGLKDTEVRKDNLLSAVSRFAKQFTDHFGIDVKIECRGEIEIKDRLAAEVLQMVYEGMSNVRKHTQAMNSTISLDCNAYTLFLSIENDEATGEETELASFTPGSLTARAEALGGQARVERTPDNHTKVNIEIPL
ncbi:MAG: GAF domain-containing protein [Pyrinomonadaceae bacterium]